MFCLYLAEVADETAKGVFTPVQQAVARLQISVDVIGGMQMREARRDVFEERVDFVKCQLLLL